MNYEKMRAEFEVWASINGLAGATAIAWQAWQASRAALRVELPEHFDNAPPYACYQDGWNDALDEISDIIESAGIRTK